MCIACVWSKFRELKEVVHYRKSVKRRKPRAAIKRGAYHRFAASMMSNCNQNEVKQVTGPKKTTLVFLDFEATGLLGPGQRPRITELCLLAVHSDDLTADTGFPRVLNKLTLCLNPKKPIQMGSSQITGLYNDTLERQRDFSPATVSLINGFLSHLEEPVCLIAHYGNGYDFPLLKAELNRINQSLVEDIYCADSLEVFRALDCLEMVKSCTSPPPFTPANVPVQFISDYKTPEKSKPEGPPGVKRKSPEPEPLSTREVSTKKERSGTETGAAVKRALVYEDAQKNKSPTTNELVSKQSAKTGTNAPKDLNSKQTVVDAFTNELLDEFDFSTIDDDELIAAAEMAEKQLRNVSESNSSERAANGQGVSFRNRGTNDGNYVMSDSGYSVLNKLEKNSNSAAPGGPAGTNDRESCVNDGYRPNCTPISSESSNNDFSRTSKTGLSSVSSLSSKISDTRNSPSNSTGTSTPITVTPTRCDTSSSRTIVTSSISTSRNSPAVTPVMTVIANAGSSGKGLVSPALPRQSCSSAGSITFSTAPKKSFKLVEIYRKVFGQPPPESHRAEDDCVSLLKCAQGTKDFLSMVDKHADLFSTIKPGY